MCKRGWCTCQAKWHAFVGKKAPSFNVMCKVWLAAGRDSHCIESGCKIKPVYPAVATQAALFGPDISLGQGKYFRHLVESIVVLTDAPFLGAFLLGCWRCSGCQGTRHM